MIFILICLFVIGAVFGSFLGVVIRRRESPNKIISARSRCDNCHRQLAWRDLIPLASFLILRGKCRFCQRRISWFYPLIELASGSLLALNGYFIFSRFNLSLSGAGLIHWLTSSLMILVLILISWIDGEEMIVLDSGVLLIIGLGLIDRFVNAGWLEGAAGAGAAGGFLALLALFGRGRWMGWGDVKLAAALGWWLGLNSALTMLFLSFILGSIGGIICLLMKRKKLVDSLPFAPYLASAALIAFWLGGVFQAWFWNRIGF